MRFQPSLWSFQQPVLVVAPHLRFPAYNGGDISIERVARHLSRRAEYVDLLTCSTVRRYRNGEKIAERSYRNRLRPKPLAGLRSIVFRSHYLHERFHTSGAATEIRKLICEGGPYGTVLASFLVTLNALPPDAAALRLVWTHNDEMKWFADIAAASHNPLVRLSAASSLAWLHRTIPRLAGNTVFLHVTEADRAGYDSIAPGHRCVVTSVGTDLDNDVDWRAHASNDVITLSFVSALGVAIAADALRHFHAVFEPPLRQALGPRLRIRIIGSNPSAAIQRLCANAGWELHANVGDEKLSQLFNETTFTILPFAYSTGIKLKLIRSIGSGVPFLSTRASQVAGFVTPPGCCFSDDPADWLSAIVAWCERQDTLKVRRALFALAREHSWPAVVDRLVGGVERLANGGRLSEFEVQAAGAKQQQVGTARV